MTGEDEMTGIEELRTCVSLFDLCREGFNEQYTPEELLKIWRAVRACEWDVLPDQLTDAQIAEVLAGKPMTWFKEGDRVRDAQNHECGVVREVEANTVRVEWNDGGVLLCSDRNASELERLAAEP